MKLTGQELYETYQTAFIENGVALDEWPDLAAMEREAWDKVAEYATHEAAA